MTDWIDSSEVAAILGCHRKTAGDVMRRYGVARKQDPRHSRIAYLYDRTAVLELAKTYDPRANRRGRSNPVPETHPWKLTARNEDRRRPHYTPEEWEAVIERARQRMADGVPHREIVPDRHEARIMRKLAEMQGQATAGE